MTKTIKHEALLLLVVAVMLSFVIGTGEAGHGSVLVLEPAQEVTERISLTVSSEVYGNLSTDNGSIDFWVTGPSDDTLICHYGIENCSFKLVAEQDGNYTMHMNNTYQMQNVITKLEYSVNRVFVFQGNVGLNFNVDSTTQIPQPPPPPTLPDVDDPRGNSEDFYRPYLNFQRSSQILATLESFLKHMPMSNLVPIVYFLALIVVLKEIEKRPKPLSVKRS
jgi:hypothetical protein